MIAQQYGTILVGLLGAGVGAFLARLAILPTLRRHTETEESIRQMIAQRNAAITELYKKLFAAVDSYRDFLSPSKGIDEPAEPMMDAAQTFTDYYHQVASIWLPASVDEKVGWLADALHNIYRHTVVVRPSSEEGGELTRNHYAQRTKARERVGKGGDITAAVDELRSVLRQVLEGRKIK